MRFPEEIGGWSAQGPETRYGPESLHLYIDGAAEVYLAFGVHEARTRAYTHPVGGGILADIFDMGSAENAFGAYHHDLRLGTPAGIGNESDRTDTAVAFWKGRYFVALTALQDNPVTREGLFALAAAIARGLSAAGAPPDLAGLLPRDGLIPSRIHFLTDHRLLNRHFFLADDDLLGFSKGARAVLGAYRAPEAGGEIGAHRILVVRYPSLREAESGRERLVRTLLPEAGADGLAPLEPGGWAGARLLGRHLIAVFDAPTRETARKALEDTLRLAAGAEGEKP